MYKKKFKSTGYKQLINKNSLKKEKQILDFQGDFKMNT